MGDELNLRSAQGSVPHRPEERAIVQIQRKELLKRRESGFGEATKGVSAIWIGVGKVR